MEQPERAAAIEERGDEEQAERDPDVPLADVAGDRVLVAAGELDLGLLVAQASTTVPVASSITAWATSLPSRLK